MLSAVAASAVAVVARRVKALTRDGAVAAGLVGFIVFGWGGMGATWPLLAFFGSATFLTRWRARRARRAAHETSAPSRTDNHDTPMDEDAKAAHRDADGRRASQVLANGGVAAVTVLAAALWPDPVWAAAYAGAVATSTADTWATELGMLSKRRPVLITTGKPVTAGQSGAVSGAGTVAGAVGAVLIGLVAAAAAGSAGGSSFPAPTVSPFLLAASVTIGGFLGMVADSVLGATIQTRFRCLECRARTEHALHYCRPEGVRTIRIGGLPGLDNDTVNFTATVVGAAVAAWLYYALTTGR